MKKDKDNSLKYLFYLVGAFVLIVTACYCYVFFLKSPFSFALGWPAYLLIALGIILILLLFLQHSIAPYVLIVAPALVLLLQWISKIEYGIINIHALIGAVIIGSVLKWQQIVSCKKMNKTEKN